MKELELVGYTADLRHLVFSDAEGTTRYKLAVDADLDLTLDEIAALAGRPGRTGARAGSADGQKAASADGDGIRDQGSEPGRPVPLAAVVLAEVLAASPPSDAEDATALPDEDEPAVPERGGDPQDEEEQQPRLSPREIQELLRAGRDPRTVAKLAGTSEGRVQRWLAPIEAEREQVSVALERLFLTRTRLGPSADPVGAAVRRNLAAKGVDEDDVRWRISRGPQDGHWTVDLRYRSRGRAQRARWRFHPDRREVEPRNDLAVELAWTRPAKGSALTRQAAQTPSQRSTVKQAAAGKQAPARKAVAKKQAPAKQAAAKKQAPTKKAAAKTQAPAKKAAVKKLAPTKKAAKTQAPAKKAAVKKQAPAKKAAAGKQAPAKKAAAKKSAAKRATARPPA